MKSNLFLWMFLLTVTANAQVTSFNVDSSKIDKPLAAKLDSIYQEDQGPRYKFMDAVKNKEKASTIDSLRKIVMQKDQENLHKIKAILDQYGRLSPEQVGMNASQALFLVIQHADLETQLTYLPMIRTAEKTGKILSSNLAILEDRINMRQGKKQVYGSQSFSDKATGML
jgi:hypothetical protein